PGASSPVRHLSRAPTADATAGGVSRRRGPPTLASLGAGPAEQAQLGRQRLHGVNDELDVLVEVHAEVGGAPDDVLAVDAAGEALALHLLPDAAGRQVADARRPQQRRRRDQPGDLVAGVQGLLHQADARVAVAEVVGVGEDAGNHLLGVAAAAEDLRAL